MPNKDICITKEQWKEVQHMVSEYAIVFMVCSNPEGIDDDWEDRIITDHNIKSEDVVIESCEDVIHFIRDYFETWGKMKYYKTCYYKGNCYSIIDSFEIVHDGKTFKKVTLYDKVHLVVASYYECARFVL